MAASGGNDHRSQEPGNIMGTEKKDKTPGNIMGTEKKDKTKLAWPKDIPWFHSAVFWLLGLLSIPVLMTLLIINYWTLFIITSQLSPLRQYVCFVTDSTFVNTKCAATIRNASYDLNKILACVLPQHDDVYWQPKFYMVSSDIRARWYWCLCLILASPEILTFIKCCWVFRTIKDKLNLKDEDNFKNIILPGLLTLLAESFNILGSCLFVFVVLPSFGASVYGISLLALFGIGPSVLKVAMRGGDISRVIRIIQIIVCTVCSVILVVSVVYYSIFPPIIEESANDVHVHWALSVSVCLKFVSFTFNYLLSKDKICCKGSQETNELTYIEMRYIFYLAVSIWKVILIFLFTMAFASLNMELHELFNFSSYGAGCEQGECIGVDEVPSFNLGWVWFWLVNSGSAALAYEIYALAGDMKSDYLKFICSIASTLLLPCLLIIMMVTCDNLRFDPCHLATIIPAVFTHSCPNYAPASYITQVHFWIGVSAMIAFIGVSNCDIWAKQGKNDSKKHFQRLFMVPLYDGAGLQQSVICNRSLEELGKQDASNNTTKSEKIYVCCHMRVGESMKPAMGSLLRLALFEKARKERSEESTSKFGIKLEARPSQKESCENKTQMQGQLCVGHIFIEHALEREENKEDEQTRKEGNKKREVLINELSNKIVIEMKKHFEPKKKDEKGEEGETSEKENNGKTNNPQIVEPGEETKYSKQEEERLQGLLNQVYDARERALSALNNAKQEGIRIPNESTFLGDIDLDITPYGWKFNVPIDPKTGKDEDSEICINVHVMNDAVLYDKDVLCQHTNPRKMNMAYFLQHVCREKEKTEDGFHVLAVDSGISFSPRSVLELLHKLDANPDAGAVTGRIYPVGHGPYFWYQGYEYARNYWLHKATEHFLGTCLFTPSCYTLIRGDVFKDVKLLEEFCNSPKSAPTLAIQNNGWHMWMFNCLLRKNHYIAYCSKAKAYEKVPCSLENYFVQRSSTSRAHVLNTLYFLINFMTIWKDGNKISIFLYLYVVLDFFTSLIGGAVIFSLMTVAMSMAGFVSLWITWLINMVPLVLFQCTCLIKKPYTQIVAAGIMSFYYIIGQVTVAAMVILDMHNETMSSITTAFYLIAFVYPLVCTLMHPTEFLSIVNGLIYFILLPTNHLMLKLFAISNLHLSEYQLQKEIIRAKSMMNPTSQKATGEVFSLAMDIQRNVNWFQCCSFNPAAKDDTLKEIQKKLANIEAWFGENPDAKKTTKNQSKPNQKTGDEKKTDSRDETDGIEIEDEEKGKDDKKDKKDGKKNKVKLPEKNKLTKDEKYSDSEKILELLEHEFDKSTHHAIFEDLVNLRNMCLFCYLLINSAVFTVVFIMQSRGAKAGVFESAEVLLLIAVFIPACIRLLGSMAHLSEDMTDLMASHDDRYSIPKDPSSNNEDIPEDLRKTIRKNIEDALKEQDKLLGRGNTSDGGNKSQPKPSTSTATGEEIV